MTNEQYILAPGRLIDDFILGERIFAGGMGSIWRAKREGASAAMVLKIPFIEPGEDVSAIVAYEVEEMIMRRLTGPHVPAFYGAGDLARLPYIAMEFLDGQSLEHVAAGVPLPTDEVVRIGRLIARAVASLHRQHVIHLDLKPANIILTARGAVLIDYGLARHDELPDLLGEESDLPMGSAPYMSPEQILGDRSQAASDIFAIGAILYELATGKPPFGIPGTRAGLRQRVDSEPADLQPATAQLPPALAEIILRCLEPDPARRYPTADQLLFNLNHMEHVTLTDRSQRRKRSLLQRLSRWWHGPQPVATPGKPGVRVSQNIANAPVIMAAVDLGNGADPLADLVRLHARRALQAEPRAKLACVTVLKTRLVGEDRTHDEDGRPAYLGRLVALKEWARAFGMAEESVSYHVIEGIDVAALLLEYARHNRVDHIVMGARGASALRRHLGSVSAQVVAEAHCSVTVVRVQDGAADFVEAVEAGQVAARSA